MVAVAGLALALLVVAAGCGSSSAPEEADVTATAAATGETHPPAEPEHELEGITGWLNSEPLTVAGELEAGRVVLIDFWTYTCINCIRTLPFLRDWQEKYAERGLTIIGVHSPEFDFEHEAANVQAAIERFAIAWPVAQDNDFRTWREFNNQFWPAKYLIGIDGEVVYSHFGEGAYQETEREIRAALEQAGWDVSDIPLGTMEPERDPLVQGRTRELYGGYERNYHSRGLYAAQAEYYDGPDREVLYEDIDVSAEERNHDQWYVQGLWRNEREAVVHARRTESLEDYLALRFVARSVNVVLQPPRAEPFEVVIEIDGRPLLPDEAGKDVIFDDDGRSIIVVDEARVYAIVELPAWSDHELKLRSNSDNFAIFAFTFGNYLEGA